MQEIPSTAANPVAQRTWVNNSPPAFAAVVVTPQEEGGWACSRLVGVNPLGVMFPP